ncbi:MAG: restriction endonuclease subunit S [bacterium]|nr:restriction endonuclease subunit S [bacterium]
MSENLPPGWTWTTVGDLCSVEYGRGLSKKERVESGAIEVYGSAGLAGHHDQALVEEPVVIVGRKGNAGAVWLTNRPSWPIDTTYFLRPPQGLLPDFFALQLGHQDLVGLDSSTTIPSLRRPDLEATPVAIAPVLEQERIVDAVEEHFSRLDAAEAALEAARRKLDATSRSTLLEICRGPWPRARLSEVIKSLKNGVFVSRPSKQPPGSPIFRISAVRPLCLRVDDVRYADPTPERADAYEVQTGDILLTRYSGNPSYVGAAAVVPREGAGILHPDKLIRVVVNRDRVLPEWIAAYLTAGEGRREIERRLKTTAGQVGISGSQLRTVQIAVPPLSHQQKVIAKIGVIQEAHERMRQQLDGVATQTQALRRSILAAGFAGRLVSQDPDDEPASVLLDRIAASRPAKPARRRART